jgi:hypothetical protein
MKLLWKVVETIAEIRNAIARRHLNRYKGS